MDPLGRPADPPRGGPLDLGSRGTPNQKRRGGVLQSDSRTSQPRVHARVRLAGSALGINCIPAWALLTDGVGKAMISIVSKAEGSHLPEEPISSASRVESSVVLDVSKSPRGMMYKPSKSNRLSSLCAVCGTNFFVILRHRASSSSAIRGFRSGSLLTRAPPLAAGAQSARGASRAASRALR